MPMNQRYRDLQTGDGVTMEGKQSNRCNKTVWRKSTQAGSLCALTFRLPLTSKTDGGLRENL